MKSLRSLGFLLLGLVLGAAGTAALFTRYQLAAVGMGENAGFVTRLDRWTGRVEGRAIVPTTQERYWKNWSAWTEPNPYDSAPSKRLE